MTLGLAKINVTEAQSVKEKIDKFGVIIFKHLLLKTLERKKR